MSMTLLERLRKDYIGLNGFMFDRSGKSCSVIDVHEDENRYYAVAVSDDGDGDEFFEDITPPNSL